MPAFMNNDSWAIIDKVKIPAAARACDCTWPRIRQELRSIKVAQLFASNGIVYQTTSGTQNARNLLRKLKIKSLPEVLGVK